VSQFSKSVRPAFIQGSSSVCLRRRCVYCLCDATRLPRNKDDAATSLSHDRAKGSSIWS